MRNSDVLYFKFEGLGVTDCNFPLDSHDINLVIDYCETPSLYHYLDAWQSF